MLTELGLYARAASEASVRVDGSALSTDWTLISDTARIDIGLASLTVGAAEGLDLKTIEFEALDPDQSGMRLTPAPPPEPAARRSSLSGWRFSRLSLPDAPSVLGRYAPPADKFWLLLVSGLALAGYAAWVMFLD